MNKDLVGQGLELPIVEEFYTIQGEGYHTGKAAYFIRIGGCDIGCSWCDTKISWSPDIHNLISIKSICSNVLKNAAKSVVVTGGEPLIYNLGPLCNLMKKNGIETFIETSGAYKLSGSWDWICLSPKKQNPPVKEINDSANELKVIVYSEEDFIWAEESAKKVSKSCKLYLQPEWSRYNKTIECIVGYIKNNPQWNISLQSHKFMKIP